MLRKAQEKRQLVLYIKTSGFEAKYADNRIEEIACLELLDGKLSGKQIHTYVNQEGWPISEDIKNILGREVVREINAAPTLSAIQACLIDFIVPDKSKRAEVIVMNEVYNRTFIDYCFGENDAAWTTIYHHCDFIDVMRLARELPHTKQDGFRFVDLCDRYGVDRSSRTGFSALQDAMLLVSLYQAIMQEKQRLADLDSKRYAGNHAGLFHRSPVNMQNASSNPRSDRPGC